MDTNTDVPMYRCTKVPLKCIARSPRVTETLAKVQANRAKADADM
jgi:hypothetical protein